MTNRQNASVIVSGRGTMNADMVVVGYQAHAEKVVAAAGAELAAKGLAEVQAKLETLMAALRQNAAKLGDPQPAFALAERVAEELGKKKPDKLTLKSFLSALVEETKSIAEIATAVLPLKDLVVGLF